MGGSGVSSIEALEALSRTRPLTKLESLRLERALKRFSERKGQKPWSRADVLRLHRHLLNGSKPATIAIIMNRTERAIWTKMWRMGWTVKGGKVWIINPGESV